MHPAELMSSSAILYIKIIFEKHVFGEKLQLLAREVKKEKVNARIFFVRARAGLNFNVPHFNM